MPADAQKGFDAPIPGQSLTKMPGGSPMEKPPQFVKENEALDFLWEKFSQDEKTFLKIIVLLKGGVAVTEIVNTFLFAGVAAGRWTLDLAFLMYQKVAWMVEALAKAHKVKYTFKRVNPDYANFLYEYKDYIIEPNDEPVEKVATGLFSGLKE